MTGVETPSGRCDLSVLHRVGGKRAYLGCNSGTQECERTVVIKNKGRKNGLRAIEGHQVDHRDCCEGERRQDIKEKLIGELTAQGRTASGPDTVRSCSQGIGDPFA